MHRPLLGLVLGAVVTLAAAVPAASAAGLSSTQVSAVVSLLNAFGVDSTTVARVEADLGSASTTAPVAVGGGTANGPSPRACIALSRDLHVGMKGNDHDNDNDVKGLQEALGVSATGYFGTQTQAAVKAWQTAHGIKATGYVGPATRAAIRCGIIPSPSTTASSTAALSANPSSGAAPLAVSFTGTGLADGARYLIEFGDGATSTPLSAVDVCMHLADGSGGCPKVGASHTYTSVGTYTATLESYVSCMWSNPRCMIATVPLATTTVSVASST